MFVHVIWLRSSSWRLWIGFVRRQGCGRSDTGLGRLRQHTPETRR
ncbi:hypothetical protein [Streptomyces sp. CB01881]|nr:hypothetical protein [Streptomyces sp. CB01881]